MHPWIARAAALALMSVATAVAAAPSYVRAGKMVDVVGGRVLTDQLIRFDNGRIVSVTPYHSAPTDGTVTDWSAYMVLPGLIDMHTHLADYSQSSNVAEPLLHSAAETVLVGAANARATLRAGFTTVHNVGNYRAFIDIALRDAINAGTIPGPRMNTVGAYLTAPGGGGEVTGLAPDVVVPADMRVGVVTDANDMTIKARNLFQRGADSLKFIATGAVLAIGAEPGQMELTEDEMRAGVAEATRAGSYATAHAHGAEGIKAAIRAGCRSIEHASLIDDEGIALAKAKGVWLVMDIYDGDYIEQVGTREGWPADYLRKNRDTTDIQRAQFTKAVKAGVKLAYGTDAGVYPHGQNARQFAYMVHYGMTPMQAIQAATVNAAELLGWQKDVGAIAPGRYADLVAVNGDALADIRSLEHVAAVIKGGAPVD
jgi:imidazolonepropionase-like amidohydrolase